MTEETACGKAFGELPHNQGPQLPWIGRNSLYQKVCGFSYTTIRLLLSGVEPSSPDLLLNIRAVILMDEKDPRGAVASSQRPRSPRVPVEFAIEVEGTDTSGKPFQVKGQATKISRGGATIVLDQQIPVGSIVNLVPPFGGKLEAEVNGSWIDEIDGRQRIGVKLLDTDGWFAE